MRNSILGSESSVSNQKSAVITLSGLSGLNGLSGLSGREAPRKGFLASKKRFVCFKEACEVTGRICAFIQCVKKVV